MKKIISLFFNNKTLKQTILKNTFWLTVANVVGRGIRAILVIYAARVLGSEGYGVFSYALAFAAFFVSFSDIGINGLLNRNLSQDTDNKQKIIATSFFIKIALAMITYSLLLISSFFAPVESAKIIIPLLGLAIFLDGLKEFGFSIIRSFQKMEIEAGVTIFYQITSVIFGFIILIIWKNPVALAMAYIFGSLIGTVAIIGYLKKYFSNLKNNFDRSLVKKIIKDAWPFAIATFGNLLLLYTDTLFLGWLKAEADIGYYNAAAKPLQILGLVPSLLAISLFPTITKKAVLNEAKPIIEKGFSLIMLFALPLAIGGFLIPELVINLMFGQEYSASIPIFRILILIPIYSFPGAIFGYALLAHNKQIRAVKYRLGSAVLNIFLNYWFINKWAGVGAATATLLSEIVGTIGPMWETWKIEKINIWKGLWRPLTATIVMAAVIILSKLIIGAYSLATMIAGTITYLLVLFLLKEPVLKEIFNIAKAVRL